MSQPSTATGTFLVRPSARVPRLACAAIAATLLSACANYAGLHGEQRISAAQAYASTRALPAERGHWPSATWSDQFGDPQLKTLIDEALRGSPTLDQARARVAEAQAYLETAHAATLPRADAGYTLTRQRYSSNALVPPPYAGGWETENVGLLSASYDLDLWGKQREALRSAVSQRSAGEADEQAARLALTSSIARSYTQLARCYALRDVAVEEIARRERIARISVGRIAMGLDTEVERAIADANLAASRQALSSLDGRIRTTRYELGALMGQGPDRGLSIARPTLGPGDEVRLPDDLPADLVSRRPDLVAARWRVEALTHDIAAAKADFYPDINLSAAIGLDAFGFGRFLTAASRTSAAGPAVHLPIFDAGALRARLKARYAEFDYAVATYNRTLVGALAEVATQLAGIRSADAQLVDAKAARDDARRADALAVTQYRAGLANQLTVLNADLTALDEERRVANLLMDRRDRQIALATALGGGFVDGADTGRADAAPRPALADPGPTPPDGDITPNLAAR